MPDSIFNTRIAKLVEKADKVRENKVLDLEFGIWGENEDITEPYFWFHNFGLLVNKGWFPFKIEDYHYFSESNQFGSQMRQSKGGSIQAFQSNLQNLIQLIKVHLMPLFQEVKKADFYKSWIDKIVNNDEKIQQEIKKPKEQQNKDLAKWINERDEAIRTIKDKWVNEVDGGRMWQINKSATEQGLDFVLLPQFFFSTNLTSPLDTESLKDQLDKQTYSVETTLGAKEQIASFLYRFYVWLPTAIRDTQVTFKLKIAALKNIYAQILMYVKLIKPLLKEIHRKSEGFDNSNYYAGFDLENPEFVGLLDTSYSFARVLRVGGFAGQKIYGPAEGGEFLKKLEFGRFGFYTNEFERGKAFDKDAKKGKSGYIYDIEEESDEDFVERAKYGATEKKFWYLFVECSKEITAEQFKKLKEEKTIKVKRTDMKPYGVMEFTFGQRRRNETKQTPQGPAQIPYMQNKITLASYGWNLFELASYKKKFQADDIDLISTLVSEVDVIKDELLSYVDKLEGENDEQTPAQKIEEEKKAKEKWKVPKDVKDMTTGPFKGLWDMAKAPFPSSSKKKEEPAGDEGGEAEFDKKRVAATEDLWKAYILFKKIHGYIQY